MQEIPPRTIQIQSKGNGRFSPDLMVKEGYLHYSADKYKKRIILNPGSSRNGYKVKVWKSNARNISTRIALAKPLRQLAIDWNTIYGRNYNVRVKGETLEIRFE